MAQSIDAPTVRIDAVRQRRMRIFDGPRFVAAYSIGAFRPYVYPVLTPGGVPVTEESPVDHPHHNSIWLGQDELNGHNLWKIGAGTGQVTGAAPQTAVVHTPDGLTAVFRHELEWQGVDGTPLLVERRVTAITSTPDATLIDVRSERRAVHGPVELGVTKEAGFGVRVLDQLDEDDGGTLVNSRGERGEAGTFDREAEWVDYWGTVAGRRAGVALFPHPDNPPHPWFTRAYGIVLCNHHRFGAQALSPDQTLTLRWRVAAHDGSTEEAGVAQLYERYLRAPSALEEALAWPA